MNKLKKLYRDFFGLAEQTTPTTGGAVKMPKASKPEDIKKVSDFVDFISDENNKDKVVEIDKIIGGGEAAGA